MPATRLTDRARKEFEDMFPDLSQAKADGRKEDAARIAFAMTEPMLPVQKALNAYKARVAHALETGNTFYGIAAVHAFQRDLAACVEPRGRVRNTLSHAEATMLLRAADIASAKAFRRESDMKPSPFASSAFVRDFEAWLDEQLEAIDAEIASVQAEEDIPATPTPR